MLTDPTPGADAREVRAITRKLLAEHCSFAQVRAASAASPGYNGQLWSLLAEVGMLGVAVPESAGGTGLGVFEQCVVLEEAGRALAPEPLLSSAAMALPVLAAAHAECTSSVASGETIAALITPPGGARWDSSAISVEVDDGGAFVTGAVDGVLGAEHADLLVVLCTDAGRLTAFEVDAAAAGLRVVKQSTIDVTRPLSQVSFDATPARPLEVSADAIERALDGATVALAAEMLGGATRALEMTLEYLGTRHQFGRPIGSFQALKHRCADAAVRLSLARELVFQIAELLDRGVVDGRSQLLAAATSRAAEVFLDIAGEAVQMHGGIGFTEEHDIGLFYRRAWVDQQLLEPSAHTRYRLSKLLEV